MIDVAVAGGGPVGLGVALYAARAGLSVTVFEPRTAPIDKACGEGLMPGAVRALDDLGVAAEGAPLRGIRYLRDHPGNAAGNAVGNGASGETRDGTRAEAAFRSGPGRGVRRTTLHAALHAAADGIPQLPEAVTDLTQDAAGVLVNGRRARYLLAADGLHSPIRRRLGLDAPPGTAGRARRFGIRAHVAMPPWTDYVEVHWSRDAEAYVTPLGPALIGIAILTAAPGPFETLIGGFPGLRQQIDGAPVSKPRGAGPLRQRSRRRVAGRVLLVGDASGYVDALTGEGIALGLAQAQAAVAAILADRPADYERDWRRVGRRYALLTHALLGASRVPPARKAMVPAAAAAPALFAAVVNQLAR